MADKTIAFSVQEQQKIEGIVIDKDGEEAQIGRASCRERV